MTWKKKLKFFSPQPNAEQWYHQGVWHLQVPYCSLTEELLQKSKLEEWSHLQYSPDLTACHYFFFRNWRNSSIRTRKWYENIYWELSQLDDRNFLKKWLNQFFLHSEKQLDRFGDYVETDRQTYLLIPFLSHQGSRDSTFETSWRKLLGLNTIPFVSLIIWSFL